MVQSLREQLRESPMFQVEEGEEDYNNNIAKEFLLGKPNLPRIYDDSTLHYGRKWKKKDRQNS